MNLEGKNYFKLTIDWNFDNEYVEFFMPTYTPKDLKCFLHPDPKKPCYTPHKWIVLSYFQITQYEKGPDNIPPIDEKGTKDIQSKVRSLL